MVLLLALLLAGLLAACQRLNSGGDNRSETANNSRAAGEASSTPPFSTREPERYQARVILRSSLRAQPSASPDQNGGASTETFIARDGESRREDYELMPGVKVSELQVKAGHFLLVPAKKLYAELKPGAGLEMDVQAGETASDFSPERLVNEAHAGTVYQKLGAEEVNGRAATKYRVTIAGRTDKDGGAAVESLIWIDDALGMPIKYETTSGSRDKSAAMYSMELVDIKQEAEPGLFELPQDYRKVAVKELSAQISSARRGSNGKGAEAGAENRKE